MSDKLSPPKRPDDNPINSAIPEATRDAISNFLFVKDRPEHVDLAFVLGSPTVNSLLPALQLFKAKLTEQILVTGGNKNAQGTPEWALYRNYAVARGVPLEALLIEKQAANTLENFMFGAKLVEEKVGWSRVSAIGICAKPFHMQRSLMTARRFVPTHVRLLALPSEHPDNLSRTSWADTPSGTKRVLEELGKISKYAIQGHFNAG